MPTFGFIAFLVTGCTIAAGFRITQPDDFPVGVTVKPESKEIVSLYGAIDSCFRKLCSSNIARELCVWNCVLKNQDITSYEEWFNIFRYVVYCGSTSCRNSDGSLDVNCLTVKCDQEMSNRHSISSAEGASGTICHQCRYLPKTFHRDCVERFCQRESAAVSKRGWESGHHLLGKVLHEQCDSSPNFVDCVQALVQNYRRKRRHISPSA